MVMKSAERTSRWSNAALPPQWLKALVVTALSACAIVEIPKDRDYPASWPAIVSPGPECRALEGNYANQGVRAWAPSIGHTGSGPPPPVWFTDLFTPPLGIWVIERAGFPAIEALKEDLHACDRVMISIEPVPAEARTIENRSTHRITIYPSRPTGTKSSSARAPCSTLVVPKSKGHPFPLDSSDLSCRGSSLQYHGGGGTWGAFGLYLAPTADGSLVAVNLGAVFGNSFWARFSKIPE
jgi:hypothetical protein